MAFIQLEDLYGSIEVIVFPNVFERCRDLIKEDSIVVISGTVNFKEDEAPKILADKISSMDQYRDENLKDIIKIRIPQVLDEEDTLIEIKDILSRHPGETPVLIYLAASGKCLRADTDLWVSPSEEFIRCIEEVIGRENIKH